MNGSQLVDCRRLPALFQAFLKCRKCYCGEQAPNGNQSKRHRAGDDACNRQISAAVNLRILFNPVQCNRAKNDACDASNDEQAKRRNTRDAQNQRSDGKTFTLFDGLKIG